MKRRRNKRNDLASSPEFDNESRKHKALVPRPHLAQEFCDRLQYSHAESLTLKLLPRARMCAEGKVTQQFAVRHNLPYHRVAQYI